MKALKQASENSQTLSVRTKPSQLQQMTILTMFTKNNDLENAVILLCWSKPDLFDKSVFILSMDVSLTTSKILLYYQNR